MTAETLRKAAALMRERAEAATPGPWTRDSGWSFTAPAAEGWAGPYVVGETRQRNDAEHIVSWHPAVALAVADWLDFQAEVERRIGGPDYETPTNHPALAIARAYLGSDA